MNKRILSYTIKLGADSYITEPMSFDNLIKTVKCLSDYWFGIEELPPSERLENKVLLMADDDKDDC